MTPLALFFAGLVVALIVYAVQLHARISRITQEAQEELARKGKEVAERNERLQVGVMDRAAVLTQKIKELEESKAAMVNILEDLTIAKKEIEAGKAYDDALLASIADGVIAGDIQGTITTVNQAVGRLVDYPSTEELIGKKIEDVLVFCREDGSLIPDQERPFYRAIKASGYAIFTDHDNYYKRKDGTLVPVAIDTAPIIQNGTVVGAIGVIRDITREKEIDRAKSEFVSLASHQLRTPLTAVGWYTELLSAPDATKEEATEYIKEIRGANRRMVDLVDALLNVSRIELGTFVIEPRPADIVAIVKEAAIEVHAYLVKKNLHLVEQYDTPTMPLSVDITLMRMIVDNLLSNAAKYTPANGAITVAAGYREGQFVLTVTDTGVGIPKKDQPDIFKRMFRTDQGRLLDPDGTGLGLYLVKSIIDASGGTISFISGEGSGTTFTIMYPKEGMKARTGTRRLRPTAPIHEL